ncbi:MAG TPA: hypothetical protein PLS84_03305 [Salinivirgaceae bacterium]|nr:hypothetical protein [Salinivirgaceae bacterium]
MKQYEVKIKISAPNDETVKLLGNLIQNTVNVVDNQDLIKLLSKVKQNPGVVKTALKFV